MKQFWRERNDREKRLLLGAAVLCLLLALYQFAWVPAKAYRDHAAERLAQAETLYQDIAQGVGQFARLQGQVSASDARPLQVIASARAADLGLGITRMQPAENGDLSIWFDAADARQLWRWAIALGRDHGVEFVKASMQRTPEQDAVRAQFLLRKQAGAS